MMHLSPQARAYLVTDPARPDTHYGGSSLRITGTPGLDTSPPSARRLFGSERGNFPVGGPRIPSPEV